jgi:hypothetical protein
MFARFGFVPVESGFPPSGSAAEAMSWIASHCRKVAQEHMTLAEKAERLMENFLGTRRFRTGLRTFARHHRRAAWQQLEMARRAEAALRIGCDDFDLADVVPA